MAGTPDLTEYFTRRGLIPLPPEQGIDALSRVFSRADAQVAVVAAEWPVIARQAHLPGGAPPMLTTLLSEHLAGEATAADTPQKGQVKHRLAELSEPEARLRLVESFLAGQVVRALRLSADPATLEVTEPLTYLGIDSLIAVELKNMIESELAVAISVVSFLEGASIASTATQVLECLAVEQLDPPEQSAGEQDSADQLIAQVDQLSDAEVDALLRQMVVEGAVANA
jgi:phthiocerol/phenolphthiocerol synthesis type-I polyketide synthase D